MNSMKIKVIALDLDGTLTQHKSKMSEEVKVTLDKLKEKYKLVVIGAGGCERIHNQLEGYEIDIIGYYGMQTSQIDFKTKKLILENKIIAKVNHEEVIKKIDFIRKKTKFDNYVGDTVEFHPNGMLTFPLLGTKANKESKLEFDPDRVKRRKILGLVKETFSDQTVFIGGSSSFDIVPRGVNKLSALLKYVSSIKVDIDEIVYFGDDYGPGGNDEDIFLSNIEFICVDDYKLFPQKVDFIIGKKK